VIDPLTGALVLKGRSIDRDVSPSALLASPLGAHATREDLPAGWTHVYLGSGDSDGKALGVALHFEGDRLYGYSVSLADPRYGTSWDDYTEEKQIAKRDAHDALLVASLGQGTREPSPRGGVYVVATMATDSGVIGTINVNVLDDQDSLPRAAEPMVYDGENAEERTARRVRAWMPVTMSVAP
jgi:hypothetical protein